MILLKKKKRSFYRGQKLNTNHGEVRVYRGTGVSRGVQRTTWERSLKNWELQIPRFEEFFWGENTLGRIPVSLPRTLGYACTFYASTSPPPMNPNFFFSNFSGAAGTSQHNPGISRKKSLISLVSRDIPNFLAPTPSRGRPPPQRKISGPKSLGLGSFFFPDFSKTKKTRKWIF